MKSELDAITKSEWLLRRVRMEKFKTTRTPIISPSAFEPRTSGYDIDSDGISWYRLACLSSHMEILANLTPEKQALNGVVKVSVEFLITLGLSVQASPVEGIAGHVVIPQLNATDHLNNANAMLATRLAITKEASLPSNILHYPTALLV